MPFEIRGNIPPWPVHPSPPAPLPQAGEGSLRQNRRGTRRGVLLAVVIVCLAVASAVLLAVVKTTVTASRQVQTQAWQTQARWLAESGLERAAARLATDADYAGETWRVPAAAFGGVDAGSNAAERCCGG